MSLPKPDLQSSFFDAGCLAGELFEPTDRYEIFRQRILPALRAMRRDLCGLYCADNGRVALEPVTLAGLCGLGPSPTDREIRVAAAKSGRIVTGVGCSGAAISAAAPVALGAASEAAMGTLAMGMIPPCFWQGSVQRMGTS